MVKFSKQFEGQLVPEWKEAFVDYWQLKKDLKKMQVLGTNRDVLNKPEHPPLARRLLCPLRRLPFFGSYGHKEHEAIQALSRPFSQPLTLCLFIIPIFSFWLV